MDGLLNSVLAVYGTKMKQKSVLNVFDYTQVKYTEENIVTLRYYQGCRHFLSCCLYTIDNVTEIHCRNKLAFAFLNMAAHAPPQQISDLIVTKLYSPM
jgi:hypothetical protein